ncbi:hypothetical protein NQ152_04920 [Microbacterium sp. zg.B48]|uniref:MmcQ/YjbR family DNA-binding protein n=1 Tax=unclassified Microbacterium TaxID=2609290 RepID=UPI00214B3AE5|nr:MULTISPECIES: hypothetical protein [unclassified Microbacterium]MCR2762845.1 hypothetical protein [Microbacterium sp. zg.B48]MCR2808432.1 hypothetical protein [Microbacterium sp. zg.B185]WIM19124.1 hypothetical protein QNO12_16325 [Microbacterium sp. zg-B185]
MPTLADVRTIALGFPETFEKVDGHRGGAGWRTADGLFVWERGPSKADLAALAELGRSWPEGAVVGVRTDGLEGKEALLGAYPDVFFTIPHFDGYPAVLVRLDIITRDFLREVITDSWLLKAPKRLSRGWLAEHE